MFFLHCSNDRLTGHIKADKVSGINQPYDHAISMGVLVACVVWLGAIKLAVQHIHFPFQAEVFLVSVSSAMPEYAY